MIWTSSTKSELLTTFVDNSHGVWVTDRQSLDDIIFFDIGQSRVVVVESGKVKHFVSTRIREIPAMYMIATGLLFSFMLNLGLIGAMLLIRRWT